MLKDQCISVTDLRTQTKKCLIDLDKQPKYIFSNNKPVAVLIDIDQFESEFVQTDLVELSHDKITPDLQKLAKKARNSNTDDLINI